MTTAYFLLCVFCRLCQAMKRTIGLQCHSDHCHLRLALECPEAGKNFGYCKKSSNSQTGLLCFRYPFLVPALGSPVLAFSHPFHWRSRSEFARLEIQYPRFRLGNVVVLHQRWKSSCEVLYLLLCPSGLTFSVLTLGLPLMSRQAAPKKVNPRLNWQANARKKHTDNLLPRMAYNSWKLCKNASSSRFILSRCIHHFSYKNCIATGCTSPNCILSYLGTSLFGFRQAHIGLHQG